MELSQVLWAAFAVILVVLVNLVASVASVRMFGEGVSGGGDSSAVALTYGVRKISEGKVLSKAAAIEPPAIDASGPEGYYVVVMYDPDAPDGIWRHWVVDNVPKIGDRLAIEQGAILEPYMGPAPPAGTGQHRYVVAIYRRLGPPDALILEPGRANWSIDKFASANHLARVGSTYFVVKASAAAP